VLTSKANSKKKEYIFAGGVVADGSVPEGGEHNLDREVDLGRHWVDQAEGPMSSHVDLFDS